MTDMRGVAAELNRCAHEMETSGDPVKWVDTARRVMTKHRVRQALESPPANLGNCNQGKRKADELHTALGRFNSNPLTVAKVAGIIRDVAMECSKW
jgi:hypothetical protein